MCGHSDNETERDRSNAAVQVVDAKDAALDGRLQAAQDATGFKLGDIVRESSSSRRYGKVIGFARVNIGSREAVRSLVVDFGAQGGGVGHYVSGSTIEPHLVKKV